MLILSLDSAASSCGACVWRDGQILACAKEQMERGQDQRLMPLILDVMKKAGVAFDQLDRIAVTTGPGSFTGLRIGLAAARGIGLAAEKPVIGIDRFSIYREAYPESENLFVILQSKRKELFCRLYPAKDACMMNEEEIINFLKQNPDAVVTGDDSAIAFPEFTKIEQEEMTICALLASKADANDPQFLPRPLYLRTPDVTFPKQPASV